METNYKATLFHPEGDCVTDFRGLSKDEIWNALAGMGSRWIFYPIAMITTDTTIVDAPEGMERWIGKRMSTFRSMLQVRWSEDAKDICAAINAGVPVEAIY